MHLKKIILVGTSYGIAASIGLAIVFSVAFVYQYHIIGFILGLAIASFIGFVC
jgi:hypothetical protein